MNWKKEAARRGYWYRKAKKAVHILSLEVILIKLESQVQLTKRQIDSDKELNEVQKAKDTMRTKYINYIMKFNEAKQENDILEQKFKASEDENNKLRQDNELLKQEIKAVKEVNNDNDNNTLKKEIKAAKKENRRLLQEKEELEQLLEPISNELMVTAEANALLINLLEVNPEEIYQAIKSNTTPEKPTRPKRKKRIKQPTDKKRKL